ncbi:MAG: hypothetical protein IJK19_01455 [Bacteroidales bacterium]|nr:hypothetical protein [Bacteroidales bacterium]
MKKQLMIIAVLALGAMACQKENDCKECNEGKPVEVTVSINGTTMSKSTGNSYANESKVNNLQILAFNANGELENYRSIDNEMSVTMLASSGEKTVWAVVNAPSLEEVVTLEELNGTLTGLADNALDGFIMTGSVTAELTDGAVIAVTVRRLVARVSVSKITAAFPDTPAFEGKTLKVTGIYMLNVSGAVKYSLEGEPGLWYNKLKHENEQVDTFLFDALDQTIENNSSYEAEHAFYPYPNNIDVSVKSLDEESRGTWSPRRSILCIEVEYDGGTGYYPIELPVIERNKTYLIEEVVITRAPGDKPYDPIDTGAATVSITVQDWELGLNLGTVTI